MKRAKQKKPNREARVLMERMRAALRPVIAAGKPAKKGGRK